MEWLGATLTLVTFSGEIFFPSEVPGFFLKRSGKNRKKNLVAFIVHASIFCPRFLRNKVQTSQKMEGYVLLLNWKAHAKIQALLKDKKLPEKVTYVVLHQAIQFLN